MYLRGARSRVLEFLGHLFDILGALATYLVFLSWCLHIGDVGRGVE